MSDIKKITAWANKTLLANEYQLLSDLEDIQMTAWSSVRRILTNQGYIYLKQMPERLSLEPIVIQILQNTVHANVPMVVAMDRDLNCFLMKDAGKPFYYYTASVLRENLIREAIHQYQRIQGASISLVKQLLELGVPDWRLAQLPTLFQQLMKEKNLLTQDGMFSADIKKISNLIPQCAALCAELAKFKIAETLDHCDLHGANILIEEKQNTLTIIDWGETVITHPFFSLTAFLRNLVQYYSFTEAELWDNCYADKNITDRNALEKMVALARKLEPIYSALAFHRLLMSSDKEKFMSAPNCRGRITKYLQEFMMVSDN